MRAWSAFPRARGFEGSAPRRRRSGSVCAPRCAWARARFGTPSGLVALALVATYPDVLGHGALVTTDVPFAAFALAAAFALDRLAAEGGARRLVVLGLALGAALATKFSAIFLVL